MNWHQFVGVVDRTNLMLYTYTDGQLTSSTTIPANYEINPAGVPVNIGRWSNQNLRFFPGGIDDVRIYRRALGASEIQTLFGLQ